jgi:hypothetical protein
MAKLFSKNRDTDTAERIQVAYAETKNATQDLLGHVKESAQPKLATARNVAQSTAANVKDVAQHTLSSAQSMTQDRLGKTKDFAQSTFKTTRDLTQDRWAKVQKSTKVGLDEAQRLLATGIGIAAALLYKNLSLVQARLQQVQVALLQRALPVAERTQGIVVISARKASENFQKATDNAKDIREALQEGYARYQRKRRRNRTLFRIGLLTGVVLALFYTPLAGPEVRRRIGVQWQHYRSYFGI